MPKIELEVKKVGSDLTWTEEYTIDNVDPEEWAADTISSFNSTLKPGEKEREVVAVKVLDGPYAPAPKTHNWVKSNLVTIISGSQSYDTMKCESCGITGKRFGLGSEYVKRDSKYRAKKYDSCNG